MVLDCLPHVRAAFERCIRTLHLNTLTLCGGEHYTKSNGTELYLDAAFEHPHSMW